MIIRIALLVLIFSPLLLRGQILLSHNDYKQNIPLHHALALGYEIIEADIYLRDSSLVVCHDEDEIDQAPTLLEMYITPLSQYPYDIRRNITLMLDIKDDDPKIIDHIALLRKSQLQTFNDATILLSGNVDREGLSKQSTFQDLLIDGRKELIESNISIKQMPIISIEITDITGWKGCRKITQRQAKKLKSFIDQVHDSGRMIRFWNVDNNQHAWNVLRALGVDIIGVDDLEKYTLYKSIMR